MHCESELAERSDFVPRSSSRLSGSAQLNLTETDESLGAILWTVASKIWFLLADRIVPITGYPEVQRPEADLSVQIRQVPRSPFSSGHLAGRRRYVRGSRDAGIKAARRDDPVGTGKRATHCE